MQIGDTVRYLNAIGGGKITRIQGQIAYVDEDGFETPMLIKELVVVLPAGMEQKKNGAKLIFNQEAVDQVKAREASDRRQGELTKEIKPEPTAMPVEETTYGDKLSLSLAFEPIDIKSLSTTSFAAVLVNDSNYFLQVSFLASASGTDDWQLVYQGELEPNMVLDLATYSHEQLPGLQTIALQATAFKKEKKFSLKAPVNCVRRLDLKKFYKLHCFRPGKYFDSPVLELELITDDVPYRPVDVQTLKDAANDKSAVALSKRTNNKKPSPTTLLPLREIDLHINQLLDSTSGLDPKAMLDVQLQAVRKEMNMHTKRKGQKIVFIHGKGDGVLREKLRSLIKKEYPKAEMQDASFREYGFGATLVTIH